MKLEKDLDEVWYELRYEYSLILMNYLYIVCGLYCGCIEEGLGMVGLVRLLKPRRVRKNKKGKNKDDLWNKD